MDSGSNIAGGYPITDLGSIRTTDLSRKFLYSTSTRDLFDGSTVPLPVISAYSSIIVGTAVYQLTFLSIVADNFGSIDGSSSQFFSTPGYFPAKISAKWYPLDTTGTFNPITASLDITTVMQVDGSVTFRNVQNYVFDGTQKPTPEFTLTVPSGTVPSSTGVKSYVTNFQTGSGVILSAGQYTFTVEVPAFIQTKYERTFTVSPYYIPDTITFPEAVPQSSGPAIITKYFAGKPISPDNSAPRSIPWSYNGSTTIPTDVGDYAITYNGTDYASSFNVPLKIQNVILRIRPNPVTLGFPDAVSGVIRTAYTGSPVPVTVSASSTSYTVPDEYLNLTYSGSSTPPTAPGSYTVVLTTVGNNVTASSITAQLIIFKQAVAVTFSQTRVPYGTKLDSLVNISPNIPFKLLFNGSPDFLPSRPGTYSLQVAVPDEKNLYSNTPYTLTQNITIDRTVAGVDFLGTETSYTGKSQDIRINVYPTELNLPRVITYNGSLVPPTDAGVYRVVVTVPNSDACSNTPLTATSTFTIKGLVQSINADNTFKNLPRTLLSNATPVSLSVPPASSGLPVVLSVTGPATLSGTTLTLTGAEGTVVLTASQNGDGRYAPAIPKTASIVVSKANQNIYSFENIPTVLQGSPVTFNVKLPSTSSGYPPVLSIISGPATLSGTNTITTSGIPGTVVIQASLPANTFYSEATPINTNFTVGLYTQILSPINAPKSVPPTAQPFSIPYPVSLSGNPVTFSIISGPATISGNVVTLSGTLGSIVLEASAPSDSTHNSVSERTTIVVVKSAQKITSFIRSEFISAVYQGTLTFSKPVSDSSLAVSVAVTSGPATLSGNILTFTNIGTVILTATQSGDDTYLAAIQVTISFVVSPIQITFDVSGYVVPPQIGSYPDPIVTVYIDGQEDDTYLAYHIRYSQGQPYGFYGSYPFTISSTDPRYYGAYSGVYKILGGNKPDDLGVTYGSFTVGEFVCGFLAYAFQYPYDPSTGLPLAPRPYNLVFGTRSNPAPAIPTDITYDYNDGFFWGVCKQSHNVTLIRGPDGYANYRPTYLAITDPNVVDVSYYYQEGVTQVSYTVHRVTLPWSIIWPATCVASPNTRTISHLKYYLQEPSSVSASFLIDSKQDLNTNLFSVVKCSGSVDASSLNTSHVTFKSSGYGSVSIVYKGDINIYPSSDPVFVEFFVQEGYTYQSISPIASVLPSLNYSPLSQPLNIKSPPSSGNQQVDLSILSGPAFLSFTGVVDWNGQKNYQLIFTGGVGTVVMEATQYGGGGFAAAMPQHESILVLNELPSFNTLERRGEKTVFGAGSLF